jgi:hypothetical protein
LEGRGDEEPFLHALREPLTHTKVVAAVRAAYVDAGIPLTSRRVDQTWSGHEWFMRWGISLQDVA